MLKKLINHKNYNFTLRFTVDSVNEVVKNLIKEQEKVSQKAIQDILREAGKPILMAVKAKVRVKSGELKKSYKLVFTTAKPKFGYLQVVSSHPKSIWVEYGHRIVAKGKRYKSRKNIDPSSVIGYAAPYPHLRPAFEENKAQAIAIMEAGLKKALDL